MREVYIFGHRKPDTDSVTSAIALSYLKNKLGVLSKPMILGHINKETEFVLNYFDVKIPKYLEDVKLQIKDLNYYKDCFLHEDSSISEVYEYMNSKNITGVPLVDDQKKLKGLLTSRMIGNELIKGNFRKLKTSYKNIIDVLNGEKILEFDREIDGSIVAASYRSTTFLNNSILKKDTVLIVGDRHSLIEAAVNCGIKLLVIVGNSEIKEKHIEIAIQNKVNIIRTSFDTFHTAKLIGLANYAKNLLKDTRKFYFHENDYYEEFKEKSVRLGHNNYPVVNDKGICLGLIRITDIKQKNRKQVILVDHNEASQSVEGLDEAEILEIIDHHNISSLTTNMPINFRNMTVGSTNTIIYSIYNENNVEIPKAIAGIMLSGIISDTLKFTSPTTTDYDKFVANHLALIASIDIEEYSLKMFKAGTDLKGKTISEIIQGDMKIYEANNKRFAISQLVTFNSEEILNKQEEYINKLNEMSNSSGFCSFILCVTDMIKDGSYIFYNEASKDILIDAFNDDEFNQGYFFYKCLSRKKQLVPLIMSAIE